MKKWGPYLLVALLCLIVLLLRLGESSFSPKSSVNEKVGYAGKSVHDLRNPQAEYYFTQHARCRMECRRITQAEVKEVVMKGKINYRKSSLNASGGPRYALEGITSKDRQHIRVIVTPRKKHLTIITVIDLEKDWPCPSCE